MADKNGSAADDQTRRATLTQQLWALGEVSSTETAHFHQMAAARYGLGVTDMKTLSALMQEGPVTAGALAQRLSLTTGAITAVIDRLERRALVARTPDPTDRRKVIVVVNERTLASRDNLYTGIGEAFARLFATYTLEQLEFLAQFYEASIALTRRETARLAVRDGAPDAANGRA